MTKYDHIGITYNSTRTADPYLFGRMEKLLQPNSAGTYLDIGCGTGNYTIEFTKKGYSFIGLDPSELMLSTAKSRSKAIHWIKGRADQIPLMNNTIDGVLATFTIHHWENLNTSFTEIQRVLKPGMHLLLLTSTPEQKQGYWLNHYFPKMMSDSINQMPSLERIKAVAQPNQLTVVQTEKYFVHPELSDLFLYSGKQFPKRYLDATIRSGISSFSSLANKNEVEKGLQQLERDIESGDVQNVIRQYENEWGDYLYILLKNEKSRRR